MIFSHRRAREEVEGESYFVSMTDMMVGVVFIFIIMLSYFALHYRETTAALTQAADKQTMALLQQAGPMQDRQVTIQVDPANMIVCLPGSVLVKGEQPGDANRHCFAYSDTVAASEEAVEEQAIQASDLTADLGGTPISASKTAARGTVTFPADQLFAEGTDELRPSGQATVEQTAQALVKNLPCYGYGTPTAACKTKMKVDAIYVASAIRFDAFTDEGREAEALAVKRAVAFHDALIKAQPQLRAVASSSGPLLRVSSTSKSQGGDNSDGGSISLRFDVKAPAPTTPKS